MEELIVDCRTGEKTRREFSPGEEAARLAEIAEAGERERAERLVQVKAQLLGAAADLAQAEVLEAEGTFTADDAADCRKRVEELKAELEALRK